MKRSFIKRTPNKKRKLAIQADKLWKELILSRNPYCEVCGEPSFQAHHFYFKGSYPLLKYEISNGIGLCLKHHSLLHFRDAKAVEEIIIEKRGKIWAEKLKEKSKREFVSRQTIGYYENRIGELKRKNLL